LDVASRPVSRIPTPPVLTNAHAVHTITRAGPILNARSIWHLTPQTYSRLRLVWQRRTIAAKRACRPSPPQRVRAEGSIVSFNVAPNSKVPIQAHERRVRTVQQPKQLRKLTHSTNVVYPTTRHASAGRPRREWRGSVHPDVYISDCELPKSCAAILSTPLN
jgi:hypothetical protein